jgi:uncharacterized membrane-anchored protein
MKKSRRYVGTVAAAAVSCLFAAQAAAFGQTASAAIPGPEARGAERAAAWQAGQKVAIRGPTTVALADQADLKLPAGDLFIPKQEGARILAALGNVPREETFVGLIIGTGANARWMVVVRNYRDGYVKDDDAKDWNADRFLQDLKENNAEANKQRVSQGLAEYEILGWAEKPTYDAASHRLVWSLLMRRNGGPGVEAGVNYNTYALGRDGYLSLNLLTTANGLAADKAVAHQLLGGLAYRPGKSYADFNASTDRVAAYGLSALIGVVVAKKLGWFALIGAIAIKFSKFIVAALFACVAGAWKLLRRRDRPTPQAS